MSVDAPRSRSGRSLLFEQLLERKAPEIVYHYTTATGALGILTSGSLWATDMAHLNDASEMTFGIGQVQSAVSLIRPSLSSQRDDNGTPFSDYADEYWHLLAEVVRRVVARRIPELRREFVLGVACFCENGDLLSQWREYGSHGYAIGFDSSKLKRELRHIALPLVPVFYGSIEQQLGTFEPYVRRSLLIFHKALVDGARHYASRSGEETSTADLIEGHVAELFGEEFIPRIMDVLLPAMGYACQIKDVSFEAEWEWRVLDIRSLNDASVHFRTGGLGLTPYIVLSAVNDNNRLPIREIVLGPGPDFDIRRDAMCALLSLQGYDWRNIRIVKSSIPYRNL